MEFSQFLQTRRNKLGLSQKELAEKLGYSTQLISNWERGISMPDLLCWGELSSILEINIDSLLECEPSAGENKEVFDASRFSEGLKERRKIKGLSQSALASKIHVSTKTISMWENELSFPSWVNFTSLMELYGVSASDLYFGRGIGEVTKIKTPPSKKSKRLLIIISSIILFALVSAAIFIIAFSSKPANKQIDNSTDIATQSSEIISADETSSSSVSESDSSTETSVYDGPYIIPEEGFTIESQKLLEAGFGSLYPSYVTGFQKYNGTYNLNGFEVTTSGVMTVGESSDFEYKIELSYELLRFKKENGSITFGKQFAHIDHVTIDFYEQYPSDHFKYFPSVKVNGETIEPANEFDEDGKAMGDLCGVKEGTTTYANHTSYPDGTYAIIDMYRYTATFDLSSYENFDLTIMGGSQSSLLVGQISIFG